MLIPAVVIAVLYACVSDVGACSCGCNPCSCQICRPLPPPCPPPVICPPHFCPPPPPCPPPLPPPPPPPCPPPLPPICIPPPPPPIIVNQCCNTCIRPCGFRARRRRSLATMLSHIDDPVCNTPKLKQIILDSITDDISESSKRIQKKAMAQLKQRVNVICAKGDIAYLAYTEMFCQTSKHNITCYAFKTM